MVSFQAVTSITLFGAAICATSSSALVYEAIFRKPAIANVIALAATAVMGFASMIGAYKIYETYLVVTTGQGYEQFERQCYGGS